MFFGQHRNDAIGFAEFLSAQDYRFIPIQGALCTHGAKGS
jgi:hypothetical protein